MTRRFRMVAGPNGSGKTSLVALLRRDYAVNFYTMLNADDIFAEVRRTGAYMPPVPVDGESLSAYAGETAYGGETKAFFEDGSIVVCDDAIRFVSPASVNSYTVALLTNFLQKEMMERGFSFSQETVFSHPSKVEALARARAAEYRTYLYYVATQDPSINVMRISNRVSCGGHAVPQEKVVARAKRSIDNISLALPFLSRAYFFDNSGMEQRFLAEYDCERGISLRTRNLPAWFATVLDGLGYCHET